MTDTTIDFTKDAAPVSITKWYDRYSRSYVAHLVDADGLQVGEAMYDGTKAAHLVSVAYLQTLLDEAK